MLREELKELERHSGEPAISLIAPMRKTFPGIKENPVILKNLFKVIREKLENQYNGDLTRYFTDRFEKILGKIDFENTQNGIGIFMSKDLTKVMELPFEPREQALVDRTFQVRDLVFTNNRITKYAVLCISESPVRLLEGFGPALKEVHNNNFPNAYIGPEKMGGYDPQSESRVDFDQVKDAQKKKFFRMIDERAFPYIEPLRLPVVLVGVKKNLSLFRSVARTDRFVVDMIEGNHVSLPTHKLVEMAWPLVQNHQKLQRDEALNQLEESIGQKKYVAGVQNAWQVANTGGIDMLLVEEDFSLPAFVSKDGSKIYYEQGSNNVFRLEDAVDDLIEIVLQNGGRVIFLSHGRLSEHERVAGITRY